MQAAALFLLAGVVISNVFINVPRMAVTGSLFNLIFGHCVAASIILIFAFIAIIQAYFAPPRSSREISCVSELPKKHCWQFSLSALLVSMICFAAGMGIISAALEIGQFWNSEEPFSRDLSSTFLFGIFVLVVGMYCVGAAPGVLLGYGINQWAGAKNWSCNTGIIGTFVGACIYIGLRLWKVLTG